MSILSPIADKGPLYPDSDRQPTSDNTLQLLWIMILQGNLDALFRLDPNVFVAGDLLWYPVEGQLEVRNAPDVLVVFGRPKGYRGSYKQWEEDNVPVTVAFEVLSPGNTAPEMADKFAFYEEHGVEEYYLFDPGHNRLHVFVRRGEVLLRVRQANGFVSPRLGCRFDLSSDQLQVFGPDGKRFRSFVDLSAQRDQERQAREQAERQAQEAARKVERLAAQLRALGVEPEA